MKCKISKSLSFGENELFLKITFSFHNVYEKTFFRLLLEFNLFYRDYFGTNFFHECEVLILKFVPRVML